MSLLDSMLDNAPDPLVEWCEGARPMVDEVVTRTHAASLEARYNALMLRLPREEAVVGMREIAAHVDAIPADDLRAMLKITGGGRLQFFKNLLKLTLEKYDGAVRWVRKEYIHREDGSSKNITRNTRVRTTKQTQYARTSQGSVGAGVGVVVETGTALPDEAKRATGTTAAMQIRFDPERPLVVEVDTPAPERQKRSLHWIVSSADHEGKPRERFAILPRLFWPGLAVLDYMNGPRYGSQGRYAVMRRLPNVGPMGHILADDAYESTGFAFNNLNDLWEHLDEQRKLRLADVQRPQ